MAGRRPAGIRLARGARLSGRLALLVLAAVVTGCAGLVSWEGEGPPPAAAEPPPTGTHVVQPGETLYKIAFRYRLDWRDLAAWNRLGDADRIYPGQSIRLSPPTGTASARPSSSPSQTPVGTKPAPRATAPSPPWRWPADGPVLWRFGQNRRNPTGIGIGGSAGEPVRAAAEAQVVYSGSGLIGYGQLIILKHNDTYLSAYGHNETLRVQEGERVSAGQVIAQMGRGPGDKPLLHFEIRLNGRPVDPLGFLPEK
jgi:lipoprotein NlpD